MSLYLVDGGVEIFRCFHGAPRAQHDGREVGAVRALLQTLASILRREDCTHVAVAWDPMAPDPKDPLSSQVPLALQVTRALGIACWTLYRAQADDGLATGAQRWGTELRTVLWTTDRDLLQCLTETVVQWDPVRKRELDVQHVRDTYGVEPASLPDWFALVGMPAKGLPGIPGWGAKAATAVLAEFPHLEDIPEVLTVRGGRRLRATLTERWLEAVLMRNHIQMRSDLPIPHTLDDLAWSGVDESALRDVCAAVGDDSVLERLPSR